MYNFAGLFIRTLKEDFRDENVHHALEVVDQAYRKQMEILIQGKATRDLDIKKVPEPLRQMLEDEIIAFMDVFREFGGIEPGEHDQKAVRDYEIIKAYRSMIQED